MRSFCSRESDPTSIVTESIFPFSVFVVRPQASLPPSPFFVFVLGVSFADGMMDYSSRHTALACKLCFYLTSRRERTTWVQPSPSIKHHSRWDIEFNFSLICSIREVLTSCPAPLAAGSTAGPGSFPRGPSAWSPLGSMLHMSSALTMVP